MSWLTTLNLYLIPGLFRVTSDLGEKGADGRLLETKRPLRPRDPGVLDHLMINPSFKTVMGNKGSTDS